MAIHPAIPVGFPPGSPDADHYSERDGGQIKGPCELYDFLTTTWVEDKRGKRDIDGGDAIWFYTYEWPEVFEGVPHAQSTRGTWIYGGGTGLGALLYPDEGTILGKAGPTGIFGPHPFNNCWLPHNTGVSRRETEYTDIDQPILEYARQQVHDLYPPPYPDWFSGCYFDISSCEWFKDQKPRR